ncbi:hypothetical protein [Pseudomonas putida]|uniref:hypothetical protein n=1 Tax=Pseudomonas putida TaxID=303 RepID=UPI002B25660F|nr:hypothetical protein [Pseudomonas putida]
MFKVSRVRLTVAHLAGFLDDVGRRQQVAIHVTGPATHGGTGHHVSAHACEAMAMAVAKKKVELSFQILPTEAVRPWLLNVFTNTVIASSF